MTGHPPPKDASIVNFLNELPKHLLPGSFQVIDHWSRDPFAIGIASAKDARLLVYVSTFEKLPGNFHIQLESPPDKGSDVAFKEGQHVPNVAFDKLLEVLVIHVKAQRVPNKK